MSRVTGIFIVVLVVNGIGCQCCRLTEDYAGRIDCIADHEHAFEAVYCPGWDLNRIGRSDWCCYRHNRLFCRCACDRCKPAPCGYCVAVETGRIASNPISQPQWSEGASPPEPVESPAQENDDRAREDLRLPTPPAPEAEDSKQ